MNKEEKLKAARFKTRVKLADQFNRDCGDVAVWITELFILARKAAGMNQEQVAAELNTFSSKPSGDIWKAITVSQFERRQKAVAGTDIIDLFRAVGLDFFKVLNGTERIQIGNPKLKVTHADTD